MKMFLIFWLVLLALISCEAINKPPHFIYGSDMTRLEVSEGTPLGSEIYRLRGEDPEFSRLRYSISGEYFSVNRDTGIVTLRKKLDREEEDMIEVIVSISDEGIDGSEPNIVSVRREIKVQDENDNPPVFHNESYTVKIAENVPIGTLLFSPKTILITDRDIGLNADVNVQCVSSILNDDTCSIFQVKAIKIGEGTHDVQIKVLKPFNYEQKSIYTINLLASDEASDSSKRFEARSVVKVQIQDIQDQPPVFLNIPYSAAIPENTREGFTVLTIKARDGDTEESRTVFLNLEDDEFKHFNLKTYRDGELTIGNLITSGRSINREASKIHRDGGIYTFKVRATELIDNITPADSTVVPISIIITDVDDYLPKFNQDFYNITISEDTAVDTPLPGLNMVVTDEDVGDNAKFTLAVRDAPGYFKVNEAFSISPEEAQGRVSVVIRVRDPQVLDYDVSSMKHELEFEVTASVNNSIVTFSTIHINLLDANDHAPAFTQTVYHLDVLEDLKSGSKIDDIMATDSDSGSFGEMTYSLAGFGSEYFKTDLENGGIWLAKELDYETLKSFALTMEARDGGDKVSTVNVLIDVIDVNDNVPIFEQKEYSRTVREGATTFESQLFIRATDIDGINQGNGKIIYSINQHNGITDDIFKINSDSGEVIMNRPARSGDTEKGIYELIIRATDYGYPRKYSEVKLFIRVGIPGNQKPIFKGNYKEGPGGLNGYRARLRENASSGTEVIRVIAHDPDGPDNLLQYYIASGAKDNFVIDSNSGVITVSPDARLDLETGRDKYQVIVYAVDSGSTIKETATTTVTVNILDVNNKPPVFNNLTYLAYVSEKAMIGDFVLKVLAIDPDNNANVSYSIIEPIKAVDKTGVAVKNILLYDYKTAFKINSTSGVISVNQTLDYQIAAIVILTVEARDLNADIDKEKQIDKVEVTIYIQSFSDDNPIFLNSGWSLNNPVIRLSISEEQPLGTMLLMLSAKESTGHPVQRFELVQENDEENYVNVGFQSGNVVLNKRLDYESLKEKFIKFKVQALARDYDITRKMTKAIIIIQVQDINDNTPIFTQEEYKISIFEDILPSKIILKVNATDLDSSDTEQEIKRGYGQVRYSLIGENANLFEVNPISGEIKIAKNISIDRERQSVLRFYVIASDIPQGGADQKTARALVTVDVLDINDNTPIFSQHSYTAVVAENVSPNASIINITASDPDEGNGGFISFELIDEGEINGLFKINHKTGEILSAKNLTGKGRTEPYFIRVRAQDNGSPALHSDASITLYIGDVVSNDGVPLFIRPTLDEIAYVSENSTIGSPVFQVVASDPDDPNLPNGKIMYKFLEDGSFGNDASSFKINGESGLIITRKLLDRETKDSYTLVLIAQDLGELPQQASRVLQVVVKDIDDHKPHFKRSLDSQPIELNIKEEIPIGSDVGLITATDEDIGENGMIDYAIINGNEEGVFKIQRLVNNSAIIKTNNKLDREISESYLLTVKCYKYPVKQIDIVPKSYNRQDPSERQILIKLLDIDDNKPTFKKDNITIGVRLNVPIDTSLITLEAIDKDSDALPINYIMGKVSFISLVESSLNKNQVPSHLSLNSKTGEIRTTASMSGFSDGYLNVPITANNSILAGRETNVTLRIFLLRDRDMLKFVFSKPPVEVRKTLEEFENAVEKALALPISINVYDTQFYSKEDNSLDFSSTSSCFQMFGREVYDLKEMKALLRDPRNDELKKVYEKYHMEKVQHCAPVISRADASMTQVWVLAIAALVGFAAIAFSCTLCCIHSKYARRVKKAQMREQMRPPLSFISAGPGMINAQSHTTLGTIGPGGSFEWNGDNTLYRHPSTLLST